MMLKTPGKNQERKLRFKELKKKTKATITKNRSKINLSLILLGDSLVTIKYLLSFLISLG